MTIDELQKFYYQLDVKYQEEMTSKEAYISTLKAKFIRFKTGLAKEDLFVELNRQKQELIR